MLSEEAEQKRRCEKDVKRGIQSVVNDITRYGPPVRLSEQGCPLKEVEASLNLACCAAGPEVSQMIHTCKAYGRVSVSLMTTRASRQGDVSDQCPGSEACSSSSIVPAVPRTRLLEASSGIAANATGLRYGHADVLGHGLHRECMCMVNDDDDSTPERYNGSEWPELLMS